jgi:ubiquinone/menaquinone biosynthesis C-methylase UbiE
LRGRELDVKTISIFLGLFALIVVIFVIWRFASRRRSLPCPVWLSWLVEVDNPFAKASRATVIVENLDLEPGMMVLDVGCGPGRVAVPIAKRLVSGQVVAIDIQPGMLRRAQEKSQREAVTNIRFVQAGAGEGKLERNHFDRALLVAVLGEIPDQTAALNEIFASLKPGGTLSVTETIFDPHFQSRKVVEQLAAGVGFRAKKFFGNRIAFTLNLEKPARS